MRELLKHLASSTSAGGLRFWTRGVAVPPRAREILCRLDEPSGPDVEVLKKSFRRSVFRLNSFSPELPSVIIKGFPLKKIESRLKYKKYGLAEFSHYQLAAARRIPLPRCYGYFEIRTFGLVKANGLLLEDLRDHRNLDQLSQAQPERRLAVLSLAIPILKLLYETGVNHIDTKPHNLMQSPDGADLRLIDWQYCSFVAPRQIAQLLLQAARFLYSAKCAPHTPDWSRWLEELHAACAGPLPRERFQEAVAALQARKKILSQDRLNLVLDGVTHVLIGRS